MFCFRCCCCYSVNDSKWKRKKKKNPKYDLIQYAFAHSWVPVATLTIYIYTNQYVHITHIPIFRITFNHFCFNGFSYPSATTKKRNVEVLFHWFFFCVVYRLECNLPKKCCTTAHEHKENCFSQKKWRKSWTQWICIQFVSCETISQFSDI